MTERSATYHGRSEYNDAVVQILDDNEIDVVLVKNYLLPQEIQAVQNDECDVEIPDIGEYLAAWWQKNGYINYQVEHLDQRFPEIRHGGIKPHLDKSLAERSLLGPLTLSLCMSGVARFYAQKPAKSARLADGNFNPKFYERWKKETDEMTLAKKLPQTQIQQVAGDAILIANHPRPTWHSVEANNQRSTLLFDYRAQISK